MIEKNISFSDLMIFPLLMQWKTKTRRIKKGNKFPYGNIGDTLWVKESHYVYGHWEKDNTRIRKSGIAWKFVPDSKEIKYTDNPPVVFLKSRNKNEPATPFWYKRIAMFMPKEYHRMKIKLINYKEEKVSSISKDDAISEGITPLLMSRMQLACYGQLYLDYSEPTELFNDGLPPIASFKTLWESLHNTESWNNDIVWALSFELILNK